MLCEIGSIRSASDYSVVYLVILKPNPVHSRLLTFFKLIKIIFPTRKNMITFSYPRSWQKALHITSLCGCEGMREVFNEIMDNSDCRHEMPTHTLIHRNTGALDQFWWIKTLRKILAFIITPISQRYFRRGYHIVISYLASSTKVSQSSLFP